MATTTYDPVLEKLATFFRYGAAVYTDDGAQLESVVAGLQQCLAVADLMYDWNDAHPGPGCLAYRVEDADGNIVFVLFDVGSEDAAGKANLAAFLAEPRCVAAMGKLEVETFGMEE